MLTENDIQNILGGLAKDRPIFHFEADFQLGLAYGIEKWIIEKTKQEQDTKRAVKIYLEYYFSDLSKKPTIDIIIEDRGNISCAIELKYKTIYKDYGCPESNLVSFRLKNQNDRNLGRYGFWKDIERLEEVAKNNNCIGYAIFLTNDCFYYDDEKNISTKNYDVDFKINPERGMVVGPCNLRWKGKSEYYKEIELKGTYNLNSWKPYAEKGNEFQYLLLKISLA